MKTLLFRAAWLSLLCFCLGAHAERLSIPGSGNPEFVLNALAQAFNARQSQHQVLAPSSTGTAGALRELEQGTATLGRVGRPLKAAGRDAVAVAGGAAVTAQRISREQLYDVYVGKITDWRELGGKPGQLTEAGRAFLAFVESAEGVRIRRAHGLLVAADLKR